MSNLNSPATQWHLSDRALTPILSTAKIASPTKTQSSTRDQDAHLQSFNALTTTAIAAFDAASRLGLGLPQRIIVETSSGPVILHSFINPPSPPKSQSARELENHERDIEGEADGINERDIVQQTRDGLRPLTATTEGGSERATIDNVEGETGSEAATIANIEGVANGMFNGVHESLKEVKQDEDDSVQKSPLLIASVFAPTLGEARKAAAVLEQTAREIQRELLIVEEEEEAAEDLTVVEEGSQAELANNDDDG